MKPRKNETSLACVGPEAAGQKIDPARLSPEARAFMGASLAPETVRAYQHHWRIFQRWCGYRGVRDSPADPHDVANYLAYRATCGAPKQGDDATLDGLDSQGWEPWKASTFKSACAAIRLMHRYNGFANPCDSAAVTETLRGVIAEKGAKPVRKRDLTRDALQKMCESFPPTLCGKRDKALILVGFAGALRRGELAALEVGDFTEEPKGLRIDLARHFSGARVLPGTKTNKGGKDEEVVGILRGKHPETCPVIAFKAWLEASEIREGRVFRRLFGSTVGRGLSPQSVALIIKSACRRAGLDPTKFAGHSVRSGLATAAHKSGASLIAIQRKGRWRSLEMLSKYIRSAELFDDDAAEGIGL